MTPAEPSTDGGPSPAVPPGASGAGSVSDAAAADEIRFRERRHIGRYIAVVVVLILCALLINSLVTNKNFQWGVVGHYLFSAPIIDGLVLTLVLSVVGMPIGIVVGIVAALMRLSRNKLLQVVSSAFIWFFLATPLLVQVIFWFNIAALYPSISVGIPFTDVMLNFETNSLVTPFIAATLALSLHEGAYMAEIIRGGILSVAHGQIEASRSIGMTGSQVFRRTVLPQALRVIIPPTSSRVITFVKNTSLVSVAGLAELLYSAQLIYSRTYETIPLLVVASLWYLVLTTVLSVGQRMLERRFSRGVRISGIAG